MMTTTIAWSVCVSVCLSVCLLVTFVSHSKTAELIEMPFEEQTRVGPRNHINHGNDTSMWSRYHMVWQFLWVVRVIEKHWESAAVYVAKESFNRH